MLKEKKIYGLNLLNEVDKRVDCPHCYRKFGLSIIFCCMYLLLTEAAERHI